MEFVKQYLKIVSYVCSGLVFAFAAFYFLANLYHYYELRKNYITDFNSQSLVIEMDSALAQIQENINTFNPNTYNGSISTSDMRLLNQNLSNCINSFNNEVINSMREKNVITIIDVMLNRYMESKIKKVGSCGLGVWETMRRYEVIKKVTSEEYAPNIKELFSMTQAEIKHYFAYIANIYVRRELKNRGLSVQQQIEALEFIKSYNTLPG